MDLGLAGRAVAVALCGRDQARGAEAAEAIARETGARTGPRPGGFEGVSADDWEAAFRVTRANVVHLVRAAVPHLRANRWGRILNIASLSAKATDRLQELAEVRSRKAGTTPEQVLADLAAGVPLRRVGTPEEFAAVAAFLCSARASFVRGATIPVDGGACKGPL